MYDYSTYERKIQYALYTDGTKSSPITLTSGDPDNPPILRVPSIKDGFILHITGSYWIIDNNKIAYGGKAIVLENASHNIFRNLEIFSIGSQGINIRARSSYNLFQDCYIHNTGANNNLFGDVKMIIMLLKDVLLGI